MITWILAILIALWCIFRRTRKDGKIEGFPLGMPRGSVRALITIMIVAFPFTYLIAGNQIPRLITNAIFVAVAFYFQTRKSGREKAREIITEIVNPIKAREQEKKEKKPLYLPKYSVRSSLIILLVILFIWNINVAPFDFQATETLTDLLLVIILFSFGGLIRRIGLLGRKKKIEEEMERIPDYNSLTEEEIFSKLTEKETSFGRNKFMNLISYITLGAVIFSLLAYTINWNPIQILNYSFLTLTLRELLLLVINSYYGFRE